MALPKEGLQRITVDNLRYARSATGNDGYIRVTVAPSDNVGQLLSTTFGYHSKAIAPLIRSDGSLIGFAHEQQLIITPYIVRQVIRYALSMSWNPLKKALQFRIFTSEIEVITGWRLSDEHR